MFKHHLQRNFNNSLFLLLISITLSLGLSGCGGKSRYSMHKDGPPPDRNIDFSRIPNARPKVEPKSRYGNKSPYKVLGRWYRVLPTANGYNQRGMISWYGAKFHGHLTSTREHYNLYGMTAASKNLPLPCYVMVTNLRNGRRAILKVNDRGPFVSTRIMDASYAAAKKLGFIGTGTTYAQVTAINPIAWNKYQRNRYQRTNYSKPTPRTYVATRSANPTKDIYLQVGAFSDLNNAKHLSNRITALTNVPANINQVQSNSHNLYRVEIGPLASLSEENRVKNTIVTNGMPMPVHAG